ncbi:MAG: hypothetical protein AAF767_06940 [Pseudomonadota bacterium]
MSLLGLTAISLIGMWSVYELNQRFGRRQHGEVRPSTAWLVIGVGVAEFFGGFTFSSVTVSLPILMIFTGAMAAGGLAMVGYYFHRRIIFRRKALYDVRRGRVTNGVPYACAWQCQLGENIERDGLIIQGVGARTWSVPGATSRRALSEALWCLKNAGVKLPDEDVLAQRLGITRSMIDAAAR